MNGGEPAHDRVIAHLDVARERTVVRKHHRVADVAIVPDMAVGQKISAMTDPRFAFGGGAAIDGNEFAKCILVADLEIGRFALVFQVLALLADRAVGMEFIPRSCFGGAAERDMMLKPAFRS